MWMKRSKALLLLFLLLLLALGELSSAVVRVCCSPLILTRVPLATLPPLPPPPAQGAARLPYHPLARLQPLAPPHRLLARPHGDLKLLRPPAFDPNAITDPAVTADTDARLASANATPRVNFADVPLTIDDGGKGTKSGLVPKLSLAGPEAEDLRSALKGSEEVSVSCLCSSSSHTHQVPLPHCSSSHD